MGLYARSDRDVGPEDDPPVEYVELPESAADRDRFRQVAEETARSLEAKRDGFHVITERADGPDLDDLVRLIRYLREHDIAAAVSTLPRRGGAHPEPHHRLVVKWYEPTDRCHFLREGDERTGDAPRPPVFVGPDGTVYDANREAL